MDDVTKHVPTGVVRVPEESTDLKAVIDAAISERLETNRRTKLTWDPTKLPIAGQAKMVGKELCLSLPYMWVDKLYYVQNMRIYMPNGVETNLDAVYEKHGPMVFAHVKEAFDKMAEQAGKADANLCKHCWIYSAPDSEAYLRHMIEVHPDIVTKIATGEQVPEVPQSPPEAKLSLKKGESICPKCGKELSGGGQLMMHMKTHGVFPKKLERQEETANPEGG